MSPLIQFTSVAAIVLLATTLIGVVANRLYRASYFFAFYLAAVFIGDSLTFFWPKRFYVWGFWMARETVYGALKLGMVLEIARLASQSFPGAAAAMRRALLAVLVAGFAMIVGALDADPGIEALATDVQPRLSQTTAFAFLTVWMLALWYHLPLHAVHKMILRGLVPYLLVFTIANGLLMSLGVKVWVGISAADAISYVGVLVFWAWATWTTREQDSEFIRGLQPWRSRL